MSRALTSGWIQPQRVDAMTQLWSDRGPCAMVREPDGLGAAEQVALGPALARFAASQGGDWLRCYRPQPTAAFSGLDRLSPGYGHARELASHHGFTPVRRGPGGRMVAYHRQSLCIELVQADLPGDEPDPWSGLAALALLITALLRRHGMDARRGEVPGEYCPGRFSVNVGGVAKVAGTAARRVRGATLLSAVLVVDDVEPLRAVTAAVYGALPLPFDPGTAGAVAQYAPDASVAGLTEQLREELSLQVDLVDSPLPVNLLDIENADRSRPARPVEDAQCRK